MIKHASSLTRMMLIVSIKEISEGSTFDSVSKSTTTNRDQPATQDTSSQELSLNTQSDYLREALIETSDFPMQAAMLDRV